MLRRKEAAGAVAKDDNTGRMLPYCRRSLLGRNGAIVLCHSEVAGAATTAKEDAGLLMARPEQRGEVGAPLQRRGRCRRTMPKRCREEAGAAALCHAISGHRVGGRGHQRRGRCLAEVKQQLYRCACSR